MKKRALLLMTILGASLICGCSSNEDANSSSGSSSSTSDANLDLWKEDDKAKIERYCGSLLPYPSMLQGEVKVEELSDNEGDYLAITNLASSFSMKDYYLLLEEAGWNTISSYSKEKVQSKSGTDYVELTKIDDGKGYDITYYYIEGEDEESSYNCLVCRNSYVGDRREESAWSIDDLSVISYVIEDNLLPYIALGSDYGLYASSLNSLYAYDYYAYDLSREYCDTLRENGFSLNATRSYSSGDYYLYKKCDSGARIDVVIDYFNGNNVYVYYTPKVTTYSEWPTALTKDAIEKSGNDIPFFEIEEGGSYTTYSKNGTTYIYSYDYSSTFDYESYFDKIYDPLYCWNEKLSVDASFLGESEEDPEGFLIYFSLSEERSTFFSSWEESDIALNLKNSLGIEGVSVPALDLSSLNLPNKSKYIVNTESDHKEAYDYYYEAFKSEYGSTLSEEDIASLASDYADFRCPVGVIFSFYDEKRSEQSDFITSYKVWSGYKEALYEACYFAMDDTGGSVYEDASGKLAVKVSYSGSVSSDNVATSISFLKGSGESHTPVFAFEKELYEVGEGSNVNLALKVKMLPYEVTYSSSDPSKINVTPAGKAICKTGATIGESVTISASCLDKDGVRHVATTEVKVVKGENYKTMMEKVEEALRASSYNDFQTEDIVSVGGKTYGVRLTLSLGGSVSKEEAKEFVNEKLIIDGYTAYSWKNYVKDDDYSSSSIEGKDIETLECWLRNDFLYLKMAYYVYTSSSSGETMLLIESTTYR